MGDTTGVGKQICDLVPQARCVGAVAHVLQLCVGDVDDIVDYFIRVLFREIISQIIAQYQLSGKRKHALEELGQLLTYITRRVMYPPPKAAAGASRHPPQPYQVPGAHHH